MGQPFKTWAVVGRGESHRSHFASHWMFQQRKLTSVGRVSEEALKTKDKIQFTFEVVPCLILGLFRQFFHRCASILAQHYKGVGEWEVGREEEKPPR